MQYGLKQLVHSSTRHDSILDLVFSSKNTICSDVIVSDPFSSSDHASLIFNIFMDTADVDYKSICFRDFRSGDYDSFNIYLNSIAWHLILSCTDSVEDIWNKFLNIMQVGISKYVPIKAKSNRATKACLYPPYIMKLQLNKKILWRKRNLPDGMKAYKQASEKYVAAVSRYHKRREMNLLKLRSKNFFTYVNNRLKSRKNIPPMKKDNGPLIVDDECKAKGFLDEFKKVFTVDNNILPPFAATDNVFNSSSINFSPDNISKLLKKFNKSSSAGPDSLPGYILPMLANSLSRPLSIIFCKSFESGQLPSMWKESFISPIFKKSDPSQFCNYRPVALTCTICRVMESIIKSAMLKFLNGANIFNTKQHGFLKGHSTGLQILECLNDWTAAVEEGLCVDVCYIDFSRAFDTVSIPKLLFKLQCYGFKNDTYNWLSNFFCNRTLRVKINDVLSDSIVQTSGIPQGSSLGLLAFLLYINDLPSVVQSSTCCLFADDVKIYHKFKHTDSAVPLQNDLDLIIQWSDAWQLTISVEKTVIMYIGAKNPKNKYKINNRTLECKDCVKDLGINVTYELSWRPHYIEICKKANRIGNAILHIFKSNDIDVYMKAFDVYVRPLVEYCSYVWNPTLQCDIDLLENVQRCFTRRAFYKCNLNRMSYPDRLKVLNICTLEHRRLMLSLGIFYKIYHKFVKCNILQSYHAPSLVLRGHTCRLFVPFCRSTIRKNYFVFKILPIWNKFPNAVVNTNVFISFMNYLHEFDLSDYLRLIK